MKIYVSLVQIPRTTDTKCHVFDGSLSVVLSSSTRSEFESRVRQFIITRKRVGFYDGIQFMSNATLQFTTMDCPNEVRVLFLLVPNHFIS